MVIGRDGARHDGPVSDLPYLGREALRDGAGEGAGEESRRRYAPAKSASNGDQRASHAAAKLHQEARTSAIVPGASGQAVVDSYQMVAVEDFKVTFLANFAMAPQSAAVRSPQRRRNGSSGPRGRAVGPNDGDGGAHLRDDCTFALSWHHQICAVFSGVGQQM